jgi:hypothetical protein
MKSDGPKVWEHPVMLGAARVSEVVATTFFTALVFGFYIAHYVMSTGFFTSSFTPLLAAIFYTSVLWTIVNVSFKAVTPRKDIVALAELVGSMLFAVTAAWFFVAFPLNFAHVADVVPGSLQFMFTWLSNSIGRIIVALIFVASIIAIAVNAIKLAWRVSLQHFHNTHDISSESQIMVEK